MTCKALATYGNSHALSIGCGKDVTPDVLSRIVVAAERYACGRMTYVVSASATAIVRYAGFLSPEQKDGIISDIKERADSEPISPGSGITALGMDCDRRTWLAVVSALESGADFYDGACRGTPSDVIDVPDLRLLTGCAFRHDIGYGTSSGSGIGLSLHEYAELFESLPKVFDTPGFRSNVSRDLAERVFEWWPEHVSVPRLTEDDIREVMEVAGDWNAYRDAKRQFES